MKWSARFTVDRSSEKRQFIVIVAHCAKGIQSFAAERAAVIRNKSRIGSI